jgi:peptide/nickel transport system ATP-binding protein
VRASLEAVGLKASDASKYPHEFSGGQRQRIAIARALITRPRLVVADEPVSALDVSVQAQTLNLMSDLEREAGVTFLLISHDLAVVAHICVTTAVMYRGGIVEIGETGALFANPAHPYTRELVDATPRLDRPARAVQSIVAAVADRGGAVNDRAYKPALKGGVESSHGCPYAARCTFARPRCLEEPPVLEAKGETSRKVACWYPLG